MYSGEKEPKMAMCKEMLEKMKAGGDPMAICKEMMAKCCN